MMDPQVSSVLTLEGIWQLVDDLFEAHGDMIPPYTSKRLHALKAQA
jgi:alpha-galactosidase